MADGGGLCIGGLGGIVGCTDHKEDAALTALIRAAALGQAGGTTRISRAAGLPILAATVTPLPLALAAGHARALALVTIRDLGVASDAGQADWMALFGLTAAEAAILPQIAAGDSMALIAQSRGVNTATVRAQVTRVLEKTGAPNMRALATMISGW
jgi:DNA-binding CsgD family transcriptional regulator